MRYSTQNGSSTKKIKYQNKYIPIKDVIGKSPVVLFEPTDLMMLTGLPVMRRKYLDQLLSQTDVTYLMNLKKYKKILTSRNSLLRLAKKQPVNNLTELLFTLNIQLIEPAMYIIKSRKKFLDGIRNSVIDYYSTISGKKTDVHINYIPSADDGDALFRCIEENTSRDMMVGYSSVGPHRDDFQVEFDDYPVEDNASRGEVRSLVLALKLCELQYIEKTLHKRPTLLMDDVLSELDDDRQSYLLNNLSTQQTFITTTHLPSIVKPDFQHIELPL